MKVAEDWIQTVVLWNGKWPRCQLCHNHCPIITFKNGPAIQPRPFFRHFLFFSNIFSIRLTVIRRPVVPPPSAFDGQSNAQLLLLLEKNSWPIQDDDVRFQKCMAKKSISESYLPKSLQFWKQCCFLLSKQCFWFRDSRKVKIGGGLLTT